MKQKSDDLLDGAKLWFGSWKNSMSSHVPSWVKENQEKYPRAKDEKGVSQEI